MRAALSARGAFVRRPPCKCDDNCYENYPRSQEGAVRKPRLQSFPTFTSWKRPFYHWAAARWRRFNWRWRQDHVTTQARNSLEYAKMSSKFKDLEIYGHSQLIRPGGNRFISELLRWRRFHWRRRLDRTAHAWHSARRATMSLGLKVPRA